VLILAAWTPALIDPSAVQRAAALYEVAENSQSYFVYSELLTLYLWVPVVVLSACILFLSPGMLSVLALQRLQPTLDELLVKGFVASTLLVSTVAGVLQILPGSVGQGRSFGISTAVFSTCVLALLLLRHRRAPLVRPRGSDRWKVLALTLPPVVILVWLLPKFLWEAFNGDGAHGFESARLLLYQGTPFWEPAAGNIGNFPGLTSFLFAYPVSWFLRLFGPLEASARLPYLLFLAVLFCSICYVVGSRSQRDLTSVDRWLIWLGLTAFTIAMGFGATYDPYHADFALPATQDTLFVACFLGFVASFARAQHGWMLVFLALMSFGLPSWLLLVGLWCAAVLLVFRPIPKRALVVTVLGIVLFALVIRVAPSLLRVLDLPAPGAEYSSGNLMSRFMSVQLTDIGRLRYLLIPAGIAPGLALLAYRRLDRIALSLGLVSLAYFAFFYVQAKISLHHFAPAMVLPVAVLWRSEILMSRPHLRGTVIGLLGIIAIMISLPPSLRPYSFGRTIGHSIEDWREGYDSNRQNLFSSLHLYNELFPRPADPRVPEELYGGTPLPWNFYAHQGRGAGARKNYVLQDAAAPPEGRLVAADSLAALYVRSDSVWLTHRTHRPETTISSVYLLRPEVLYRALPDPSGSINLRPIARRLGFDIP
jgi:hypothetical protein